MTRAIILVISVVLAAGLLCQGTAWLIFQNGQEHNDLSLVKAACQLDPFNSNYAYEEYLQSNDLNVLKRAIRLEPTRPAYHMYYGLMLIKQEPRTREGDQNAVREICLAAELKPYSLEYHKACEDYKAVIPLSSTF